MAKFGLFTSAIVCVALAIAVTAFLDDDTSKVVRYEVLSLLLSPLFQLGWKTGAVQKLFRVSYDDSGLTYSRSMLSEEHFNKIRQYEPTEKDVFVVTFAKSGTHYTVQMALQVLAEGKAEFRNIHEHMAILEIEKVSPKTKGCEDTPIVWIDNLKEDRPYKNIIATHIPLLHVPYSPKAKYIVMARNPLDTLLSNFEVMQKVLGPRLAPGLEEIYGLLFENGNNSWPEYYRSLWEARHRENFVFLFYEDALEDPVGTINVLANHLGMHLDDQTVERVRHLCSYKYMKANAKMFEPPECVALFPFSPPKAKIEMVNKGKSGRGKHEIPKELQKKLHSRLVKAFEGSDFPIERYTKGLEM